MSKRVLHIEINCGDKTCASEPGKFCPYLQTSHFGTRFHCQLFTGTEKMLEEQDGWLQRHPDCLRNEAT